MTITQMLSSMTACELGYWEDVYNNEFIGDERADYRSAQIAAMVANWSGKTMSDEAKPYMPFDLMAFSKRAKEPPKERTQEEEEAALDRAMKAIMGFQRKEKAAEKPK
jgi:hypothetical protein